MSTETVPGFEPPVYTPPGIPVPTSTMPRAYATTPSYGANPYAPTPLAPGGSAPLGSTATVINTLGIPVPAPEEATPDQLIADIETGLAKLETVNPALAQQMREQHGMAPTDDGGLLGFLGDVKDGILGGAGKALELLGRTSHIVPAAVEAMSGNGPNADNVAGAAWDALTGQDQTNWNDVFQGWGWEGDGVSGAVRATLGFAGDIASDPLTWATFGAGAGATAAEKGALTAKAVATKMPSFTARAAELGVAKNADEAAEALTRVYTALEKAPTRTEQAAQALASTAGRSVDDSYRQLAKDMFEAADNVYNSVQARTFSTWLRKGKEMTLESGNTVDPGDVKNLIKEAVKAGQGKAPKSAEWLNARAMAGAQGGFRYAPYIPFTNFRYISPMLPGSNAIQPLARTARFMAGKSASKRMELLIRNGEATWDDLALLHRRGLSALRQSSDPAQRRVFEKLTAHGRGSSAFYSASERMGGLTARFAKGTVLNRAGLAGYFTAQHSKALKGNLDHIQHHLLYDVVGDQSKSAGLSGRDYLFRRLKDTWGITDDSGSAEDFDTISRYMDYFGGLEDAPIDAASVSNGKLDTWFWDRRDVRETLNASADAEGQVSEATRAELQDQLDDMKDVLSKVPEGSKRDALNMLAAVEDRGRQVVNEYGVLQGDAHIANLDDTKELHPDDVGRFNGNAHASARDGQWFVVPQNTRMGVTDEDAIGHADLGVAGVRASRTDPGGAMPVAINPRKVLVVGEGETVSSSILNDAPIVQEARERANAQMVSLKQTLDAEGIVIMPASPLHPTNWDRTVAELVTKDLRERGGLEYDAVLFRGREGGDEMVLLGSKEVDPWNQVKAVNPSAPRIRPTRGYFHRTFTKEAQEFLHGKLGDRAVFAVRDVATKARRRAHGMTFRQSEDEARRVVLEELEANGASAEVLERARTMPLFERNPMKVHNDYVNNVAETVNGVMTGELLERMNSLGQLLPARFGRYVTIDTAQYEVDSNLLKAVRKAMPEAEEAANRFHAKERKLMAAMQKSMEDDSDRLSKLLEAWARGDEVDLASLGMKNPRLQRLLEASDDLEQTVREHRARTLKTIDLWKAREADLNAVEQVLNEGGILIRDLDDFIDPEKHLVWEDLEGIAAPSKEQFDDYSPAVNQVVVRARTTPKSSHPDAPTQYDPETLAFDVFNALNEIGVEDFNEIAEFLGADGTLSRQAALGRSSGKVTIDDEFASDSAGVFEWEWTEANGDPVIRYGGLGEPEEIPFAPEGFHMKWTNREKGTSGQAWVAKDADGDTWRIRSASGTRRTTPEGGIDVYHGTTKVFDEPKTGRVSKGGGRARGAGGDLVGPEHYVTTSARMASSGYANAAPEANDIDFIEAYNFARTNAQSGIGKPYFVSKEWDENGAHAALADYLDEEWNLGRETDGGSVVYAISSMLDEMDVGYRTGKGSLNTSFGNELLDVQKVDDGFTVTGDGWDMHVKRVEGKPPADPEQNADRMWVLDRATYVGEPTIPNVRKGKLRLAKDQVFYYDEELEVEDVRRVIDAIRRRVSPESRELADLKTRQMRLGQELQVATSDMATADRALQQYEAQVAELAVRYPLPDDMPLTQRLAIESDLDKARQKVRVSRQRLKSKQSNVRMLQKTIDEQGLGERIRQMEARGIEMPGYLDDKLLNAAEGLEDDLANADAMRGHAEMVRDSTPTQRDDAPLTSMGDAPEKSGLNGEQVHDALRYITDDSTANDILEDAGYEAIHYNGGARLGGGHSHEAFGVFNPEKTIVHYGNWRGKAKAEGKVVADDIENILDSGELGIHPDGTITTRDGRLRQAGKGGARKVHSRADIDSALRAAFSTMEDLQRAAKQRSLELGLEAEESVLPKAVVAKQRKVERAVSAVGKDVQAQSAARAKAATKNARRVERTSREATNALTELNTAIAASEGVQAPLKPAVVIGKSSAAGGREGMMQVNVPGLDDVWMHEYMAEELNTLLRGKPVGELRNAWREFVLTPWKKWATYRSPGFHVRNAFGAWFNNALGGVTKADYDFSFRVMRARDGAEKWAKAPISDEEFKRLGLHLNANFEGFRPTYADIADMLADQGIGRSNATTVALVEQTAREGSFLKAEAGRAVRGARHVDSGLRKAGALTEDYFRTAAWAAGMRATMGDFYGARAFTMVRHGDYADLTETEDFIKDLVPFYKWMRTNIPYQFRMLAEEPGKLLMVQKAQRSLLDAAGLDSEEYERAMPDWMSRGVNIPLPFTGKGTAEDPMSFATLDMPYGDLFKGGREYLASILPLVSDVAESTVIKQDIFTGRELTGEMVPLGGMFDIPGLRDLIAAFPGAMKGADGKVYIPDTLDNALGGIPVYGRFRNWITGDPNRVEKRWGAITSFFGGVPVREVDLNADELAFYYDELEPSLEMYRSLGYVFPTKEQLQAAGMLALTPTPTATELFPTGTVGTLPVPAGAAA